MKPLYTIAFLVLLIIPCIAEKDNATISVVEEGDTEWLETMTSSLRITQADLEMFSSDETNSGQIASCQYLKLDALKALNYSKSHNVSKEYQKLKHYYESIFKEYYECSTNLSEGLKTNNVSKLESGKSHLLASERYRVLIEEELDALIDDTKRKLALKNADFPHDHDTQKIDTNYKSEVFDYLGTNNAYQDLLEDGYKELASEYDVDFLEVDCFFWEDYVSFTVVVDDSNASGTLDAAMPALMAYSMFYNTTKWPEKAEVTLKSPGSTYGKPLANGVIYSMWVEDYYAATDKSAAQKTLIKKYVDTFL